MLDALRRLTSALMLVIAVSGLMPMLPLAFGFYSADVTNNSAGTYYPTTNTTDFLSCGQDPAAITLKRNNSYTGNYFRCTNNWGAAVTVTWSVVIASGTGLTATGTANIPAGAQGLCVPVTLRGTSNRNNQTVVYKGTIDQSDLYAEIQFTGTVTVQAGNSTPAQCA